jgi:glutaredoxin
MRPPLITAPRFLMLAAGLLLAATAAAQTYRWIDPKTGKTVYSDQPPPAGAKQVLKTNTAEHTGETQRPYATRQAAEKFPVTLYTSANCAEPCQQARALLNGRGVPFSEKEIKSKEDLAELSKTIGSEASVPTLFVGREHLLGFEDGAWNKLLDLATYPKSAPYGAKPTAP